MDETSPEYTPSTVALYPCRVVLNSQTLETVVDDDRPLLNSCLYVPRRQVCADHCSDYAYFATQYGNEVRTKHPVACTSSQWVPSFCHAVR